MRRSFPNNWCQLPRPIPGHKLDRCPWAENFFVNSNVEAGSVNGPTRHLLLRMFWRIQKIYGPTSAHWGYPAGERRSLASVALLSTQKLRDRRAKSRPESGETLFLTARRRTANLTRELETIDCNCARLKTRVGGGSTQGSQVLQALLSPSKRFAINLTNGYYTEVLIQRRGVNLI
jgi:hypothetical protein